MAGDEAHGPIGSDRRAIVAAQSDAHEEAFAELARRVTICAVMAVLPEDGPCGGPCAVMARSLPEATMAAIESVVARSLPELAMAVIDRELSPGALRFLRLFLVLRNKCKFSDEQSFGSCAIH